MQTRPLRGNNVRAARRLRIEMIAAEAMLWDALRDRRLDGWKFRRQHPVGRFVIDFYCADVGVAIEVDGGVHLSRIQRLADVQRQESLEGKGIEFLRFSNERVERELATVLRHISAACAARPVSPSLRARGEGAGG